MPVLTDSVEELAALHHLHDDQESGSVSNKQMGEKRYKNKPKKNKTGRWQEKEWNHKRSSAPRAGLVRKLHAVRIDLQDLDDVRVVGAHHM